MTRPYRYPYYCPVLPAWLLEARLAEGRWRRVHEGYEKRCSGCPPEVDQWHPADTEYFGPDKSSPDGLKSWCRCCENAAWKRSNQKRRAAA